ncbi:tubulin polyglutamylase TTLL11 isoform 2-T2 [Discoglossus pictus]
MSEKEQVESTRPPGTGWAGREITADTREDGIDRTGKEERTGGASCRRSSGAGWTGEGEISHTRIGDTSCRRSSGAGWTGEGEISHTRIGDTSCRRTSGAGRTGEGEISHTRIGDTSCRRTSGAGRTGEGEISHTRIGDTSCRRTSGAGRIGEGEIPHTRIGDTSCRRSSGAGRTGEGETTATQLGGTSWSGEEEGTGTASGNTSWTEQRKTVGVAGVERTEGTETGWIGVEETTTIILGVTGCTGVEEISGTMQEKTEVDVMGTQHGQVDGARLDAGQGMRGERTMPGVVQRVKASTRTGQGIAMGSDDVETTQRGSQVESHGVTLGSEHGVTARISTKPKDRNKRSEVFEEQTRTRFTQFEPGVSLASCGSEKSDPKMSVKKAIRYSGRVAQPHESKVGQKKVEGRGQKRPVTVDSSKAKTSLEALKISIKELKWKEFPLGRRIPCDIYWHGVSFHDSDNICSGQVNKLPGMTEMVRKINLSRAVRTMQELFPEEYNFYPKSWILPEEFQLFAAQVRMAKENDPSWKPTFIVKPDGGCQGDGIYLIKDPNEIRSMGSLQNRPSVVQEYISKPLLMDNLKFDIRLYVLLRSIEPLEIYIAKDGLSRFCTEPYQAPHHKNLHHVYMHLTNYSLNIHSGNFIHSDSVHTGSKRTFSSILYRLSSKGVDIKKVWSDIISLVIKTIIALLPELKVNYQAYIPPGKPGPTCFQILGFDILLRKNLKPVLLEVNANPSMKIDHEQELIPGVYENVPSPVDEEVKIAVIRDTLRLMDPTRKKNSHNQPCPSDTSLDAENELHTDSTDQAEPDINKSSEGNLPSLCLKQVFPKYSKQFNYMRVVERMAAVFIRFLGIKDTMKMGPTGFRTFIRSCKLSNSNFSMASVDILYIDITRRWSSMGLDQRESGMCLQAFVEAFVYLAQRRFKDLTLQEQVESLINLCESHLESLDEKKLPCSRGLVERRTTLSSYHQEDLRVTSHVPHFKRTSTACKLTDYKLQHS